MVLNSLCMYLDQVTSGNNIGRVSIYMIRIKMDGKQGLGN